MPFTGPPVSALDATIAEFRQLFTNNSLYTTPFIQAPTLPPGGIYQAMLGAQQLNFDLADQSTAASKVLLPVPTTQADGGGQIRVQLVGLGPACRPETQPRFIYDSGALSRNATEHVPCCPVFWSNVTRVFIAYQDVYQNNIVVAHEKSVRGSRRDLRIPAATTAWKPAARDKHEGVQAAPRTFLAHRALIKHRPHVLGVCRKSRSPARSTRGSTPAPVYSAPRAVLR